MAIRELLGAILRRWYVVVVVLGVAVGVGYLLHRDGGVYTTKTVVSFMLPDKTNLSLNSGLDDASVIAFAGLVAQEVNNGREPARYSTDEAPFYGAGVREGVLVTLPNAGNQWVTSYLRAEIELQIVGPTEEWVAQTQADLLRKVTQVADAQQVAVEPVESRIQTEVVPLTKRIFHVVPTRSAEIQAFAALFAAALLVGGWAALILDGAVRNRRTRRSKRASLTLNEGLVT